MRSLPPQAARVVVAAVVPGCQPVPVRVNTRTGLASAKHSSGYLDSTLFTHLVVVQRSSSAAEQVGVR